MLMDLAILRNILFWCTLINLGTLLLWWAILLVPHEWLYRYTNRFYRVSSEQFEVINVAGIAFYKVLIILFNLVPYIALWIVG